MTTDILSRHLGAVSDSATALAVPSAALSHGYVTKEGILFAGTSENYSYFILDEEVSPGDMLHVRVCATPNVAVFSRANAQRTSFVPEVLGTDASQYLDYYYLVGTDDAVCISFYLQIQTVEKISNALAASSAAARQSSFLSERCHGTVQDVTPANILTASVEGRFVHIDGRETAETRSRMSRPILVTEGDVVWLRAQATENYAVVARMDGTESAPTYTPLVGGHLPRDTEPSEYRCLIRENCLVVLSWYEGPGADPLSVDAGVFRSFLSEALTARDADLSAAVAPQVSSGNSLTSQSFNGGPGATYLIDRAYTIGAGVNVEIPADSTLYYRAGGRISSLGSGSAEGTVKFQNTLLLGRPLNDVALSAGSTLANSRVRTSWFCPSAAADASDSELLAIQERLNALVGILDRQVLDFDQDFRLVRFVTTGNEHLLHLALDGILLKSNIRYCGNRHTITLKTAYTAFTTRTHGDPSEAASNYVPVCNICLSNFEFSIDPTQSYSGGRNVYSIINFGSIRNACVESCHFDGWRGTAVNVNFIYDHDTDAEYHSGNAACHTIATADGVMIRNCVFDCNRDVISFVGNGITISNGQHIVVEKCEFNDINTSGSGDAWPGPIDIEAEVKTGGVVFDDITVRNNVFSNCGNRAAINLAGLTTADSPLTIVPTTVGRILIQGNHVTGTVMGLSIISLKPVSKDDSSIEITDNTYEDISGKAVVISDTHMGSYHNYLCNISLKNCSFTATSSAAIKGDYEALKSTIDPGDTCTFTEFSS